MEDTLPSFACEWKTLAGGYLIDQIEADLVRAPLFYFYKFSPPECVKILFITHNVPLMTVFIAIFIFNASFCARLIGRVTSAWHR
jgi:hypothetical protein